MKDIIASVSVNPKNQAQSILKQIGKVLRGTFNIIKYNWKDLRKKWGRRSMWNSFKKLFANADITADVGIWQLVRGMKHENMADLMDEFCNCGMKDYHDGVEIGKMCQSKHRTIQASIMRFCLGVIIALGEQEYTDARNEMPVAMAKKIKALVEDGTLKMGWMI